jgi:hypothetical protein
MLVEAFKTLPDINMDSPIQLTLFALAETVTVIVDPGGAVDSSGGFKVTLPVTPEFVSKD